MTKGRYFYKFEIFILIGGFQMAAFIAGTSLVPFAKPGLSEMWVSGISG